MPSTDDSAEQLSFERVDWDEVSDGYTRPRVRTIVFLASLLALASLYLYERYYVYVYLVAEWQVSRVDWLFLLSLCVFLSYVVVPAVRNRRRTREYWRRLRRDRIAAAATVSLLGLILVGVVGPFLTPDPWIRFHHQFLPPVGFTSDVAIVSDCPGGIADGRCRGSMRYPLGTNLQGYDILTLVVHGAYVAVVVSAVAAFLIVPVAAGVGVFAGYLGGRVDDLLMVYVDVQSFVPAIMLYLLFMFSMGKSLFLLLVAFGLLSWGGIARLVRSETLQRREEGYVLAARSAGASERYVVRTHLLPNVSSTIVPAVAHLIPVLVLTEAGIAFLGFGDASLHSWGNLIEDGLRRADPAKQWWVSTIPALLLGATATAFKLAGDGLRDALDPRGDR